jgi:hypothetical protein
MFTGTESTRISSSEPEDQVYAQIEEGLRNLGSVRVTKTGAITIDPGPNLSNALTATTATGLVTKEGEDYVVKIDYDLSPTTLTWVLTVVLGCLVFPFGFAFFLLSLLQKGTVTSAIQNGFQSLRAHEK